MDVSLLYGVLLSWRRPRAVEEILNQEMLYCEKSTKPWSKFSRSCPVQDSVSPGCSEHPQGHGVRTWAAGLGAAWLTQTRSDPGSNRSSPRPDPQRPPPLCAPQGRSKGAGRDEDDSTIVSAPATSWRHHSNEEVPGLRLRRSPPRGVADASGGTGGKGKIITD